MEKDYDFSGWKNIYIDENGITLATDPKPNADLGIWLWDKFHERLVEAIESGRVHAVRLKSIPDDPRFKEQYGKIRENVLQSLTYHQKELNILDRDNH